MGKGKLYTAGNRSKPWAASDWVAPQEGSKKALKAKTSSGKPRIHRHRENFSWTGVRTERYKADDGTWQEVIRRVLAGDKGENTKFHLRYFEVSPGGHTTFEYHRHEHVVISVRGKGKARIGEKTYSLEYLDTLYIPPDTPHQLMNPFDEPFGFFCIVDARRDRPEVLKQ